MGDGELTYCFTRIEGTRSVRVGHYGPHQVGLGLVLDRADPRRTGRWVLSRAIVDLRSVRSDTGDIAGDIDAVHPLLNRPEATPFFVEVGNEEAKALRRLLAGAQTLWAATPPSEPDNERGLLHQLAQTRTVAALGLCLDLRPVAIHGE